MGLADELLACRHLLIFFSQPQRACGAHVQDGQGVCVCKKSSDWR